MGCSTSYLSGNWSRPGDLYCFNFK